MSLEGLRVLVVDDEPAFQKLLEDILRFWGCSGVESALDGREGVSRYEYFRPDVVVMDMDMPVMNGFDASRLIRDMDPEAAIVVLTGVPEGRLAKNSLEKGFVDIVIPKPFEFDQLEMGIREAVKGRKTSSDSSAKKGAVA